MTSTNVETVVTAINTPMPSLALLSPAGSGRCAKDKRNVYVCNHGYNPSRTLPHSCLLPNSKMEKDEHDIN